MKLFTTMNSHNSRKIQCITQKIISKFRDFGFFVNKGIGFTNAREKELLEKAKVEKIESAKAALSIGLTVDQVAKITDLPVMEVRKLQ